jgi:hypothetical protein
VTAVISHSSPGARQEPTPAGAICRRSGPAPGRRTPFSWARPIASDRGDNREARAAALQRLRQRCGHAARPHGGRLMGSYHHGIRLPANSAPTVVVRARRWVEPVTETPEQRSRRFERDVPPYLDRMYPAALRHRPGLAGPGRVRGVRRGMPPILNEMKVLFDTAAGRGQTRSQAERSFRLERHRPRQKERVSDE